MAGLADLLKNIQQQSQPRQQTQSQGPQPDIYNANNFSNWLNTKMPMNQQPQQNQAQIDPGLLALVQRIIGNM